MRMIRLALRAATRASFLALLIFPAAGGAEGGRPGRLSLSMDGKHMIFQRRRRKMTGPGGRDAHPPRRLRRQSPGLGEEAAAVLAVLFLLAGAASAQDLTQGQGSCSGAIASGTTVAGKNPYDPYSAKSVADAYSIIVTNTSGAPCTFALNFQSPATQLKLGKTLVYALLDANGREQKPDLMGAAPAAQFVSPVVRPHATYTFNYQIAIERAQTASAGDYSDTLRLGLYAVNQGQIGRNALDAKTYEVTYRTPQSLSVNLKGGDLATTLSFAPFVAGTQRQVIIEARSNQPYRIQARSDNDGAMVLTPAIPGQRWSVPYTATLDGARLDLSRQASGGAHQATAPRKDATYILAITIGDAANKRAGTYKDVITVEIAGAAP
jgi:hypothetical protein